MKNRAAIYQREAAEMLHNISLYPGLTEEQLCRFFPEKEATAKTLLAHMLKEGRIFCSGNDRYQLCEDSKALAFYVGCSAPIKATAHTVTAQPFHVSQAELSKATAAAAQNADELQMQIAVHTFFQNCAALCMPPQRVREACHLLLERPGENMIPQETLEQTFKEIEKAPTAEALEQLLCLILQERMGLSKIALSKFKKEVQAVIIYVNAHYMDKLTLDGIADYVGLNREYLSRLFSKETGIGLFQYINEVRMKRAGEMIRSNKQVYIKEVAAAVGFDDPYFFSRKFKDFYGKTPSEYAEA